MGQIRLKKFMNIRSNQTIIKTKNLGGAKLIEQILILCQVGWVGITNFTDCVRLEIISLCRLIIITIRGLITIIFFYRCKPFTFLIGLK